MVQTVPNERRVTFGYFFPVHHRISSAYTRLGPLFYLNLALLTCGERWQVGIQLQQRSVRINIK